MANQNFHVKYTLDEANIVKRSLITEREKLVEERQATRGRLGAAIDEDIKVINKILGRDF